MSFGLTPVFLTNDQDLLTLIRGYLEEALGTRVQLVQRRTYQEITAMLLAGQIDAAWICGYPTCATATSLRSLPFRSGTDNRSTSPTSSAADR